MKFFLSLVIAFSSVFCGYSQSAYEDGEWLSFKIKYGWFNTSKATLEIKKTKLYNEDVYHIIGNGKSVGLLDVFFKVRDRYETYVNQDGLPVKFIRDINEGGYKKHKELYFDHDSQRVKVVDYKRGTTESFDFELNTQDMVSAFYKLRNSIDIETLQIGQEFRLNMFFDNENYDFKTKFLGYEVLDSKFGRVACLKFRPYVKAERVFEAQESLTFWITADKNKIPLKIEAELSVGSLIAELDAFKGLSHSFEVIID
jgi:hypothetical protein